MYITHCYSRLLFNKYFLPFRDNFLITRWPLLHDYVKAVFIERSGSCFFFVFFFLCGCGGCEIAVGPKTRSPYVFATITQTDVQEGCGLYTKVITLSAGICLPDMMGALHTRLLSLIHRFWRDWAIYERVTQTLLHSTTWSLLTAST